jgi:tRNA(Ile2) C34 agmatinyltransferase TiaS
MKCSCGGNAILRGNFLGGYQVRCKKCGKHTNYTDKVTAMRRWENRNK